MQVKKAEASKIKKGKFKKIINNYLKELWICRKAVSK